MDIIQNSRNFPIITQSLVIDHIANYLVPPKDILTERSHGELYACGQDLSAFMLSCKGIGHKKFLKEKMNQVKECYREKYLLILNEKYPLFANNWKPGSDLDLDNLFAMKKWENATNIDDEFRLIRVPQLILKVISQAHPEEMLHFELFYAKKKLKQTTKALLLSCKALYNCKPLQEFHIKLKKLCLINNGKVRKIGEKFYNYPGGPGSLHEIFLTGCSNPYSGSKDDVYVGNRSWNEQLEKHAKEIVTLFRESLNCITLQTRLRLYHAPFDMACMNKAIPLSMIEFLLENKADPTQCCRSHLGSPVNWSINPFYYISENDSAAQTRFLEIVKLVEKYHPDIPK